MPSASDELRENMRVRFGDHIGDEGPMKFLRDAGYVLTRDWTWLPKEGVTSYDDMTPDEYECLLFLVHEWDFGGLATPSSPEPREQDNGKT